MRSLAMLCRVVVITGLCAPLLGQESGGQPQKSSQNAAAHDCTPATRILPDGDAVIQTRDCSTTRISKEKLLKSAAPPAEQLGAEQPVRDESAKADKLREMKPQALPPGEDDPKLRARYLEAMDKYFDYYTAGYLQRQRVFEWQLISSKIIFVLVTLLVASGVYFAALHFHEGMRRQVGELANAAPKSVSAQDERPLARVEDSAITTFSASAKGIAVSSPVLGVIILVISLAFF